MRWKTCTSPVSSHVFATKKVRKSRKVFLHSKALLPFSRSLDVVFASSSPPPLPRSSIRFLLLFLLLDRALSRCPSLLWTKQSSLFVMDLHKISPFFSLLLWRGIFLRSFYTVALATSSHGFGLSHCNKAYILLFAWFFVLFLEPHTAWPDWAKNELNCLTKFT